MIRQNYRNNNRNNNRNNKPFKFKKNYNNNFNNNYKKKFKFNRYKNKNFNRISIKRKRPKLILRRSELFYFKRHDYKNFNIKHNLNFNSLNRYIIYNFLLSIKARSKAYSLKKFNKKFFFDKNSKKKFRFLYKFFKFKKFCNLSIAYNDFLHYFNFYKYASYATKDKTKFTAIENNRFKSSFIFSRFRKNNVKYQYYKNNNKLSNFFKKLASKKLENRLNKKFLPKQIFTLEKKFILIRLIKKRLSFLNESFLNKFKTFFIFYNEANRYKIYSQKKRFLYSRYFYKHFLERKKKSNYFKFFFLKNKKKFLFNFFKTCRLLRNYRSLRFLNKKKKKKKKLGYYARRRLFKKKRPKKNRRILKKFDDFSFLINCINRHGKKNKASSIFFKTYYFFKKEVFLLKKSKVKLKFNFFSRSVLYLFIKSISLATPVLILKQKTIAGKKHKIPYLAPLLRRRRMGIRWIIKAAKEIKEAKPFFKKLAKIFLDTLQNKGSVIKRKKEYYSEFLKGRLYVRFLKPIQKKKHEKFKKTKKKKTRLFRSKQFR